MIFAEFLKSSDHYVTGQIEPKLPKALLLPQVENFEKIGELFLKICVGSRITMIKNGCLLRSTAITSHRLKFSTLFTCNEYHLDHLCFVTEK